MAISPFLLDCRVPIYQQFFFQLLSLQVSGDACEVSFLKGFWRLLLLVQVPYFENDCDRQWASQVAQTAKNPPAMHETWVRSLGGKIRWRREWLPTPVFLPRELHGQRSLVGYSPWSCKETDTTEQLTYTHTHTHTHTTGNTEVVEVKT